MSENLEERFRLELRKRKKKHRSAVFKFASLLLSVSAIFGLIYLLVQSNNFIKIGNLAIPVITPLLIILGLILSLILTIYIKNYKHFQDNLLIFSRLKNINKKHLFGVTLLVLIFIYWC